MSSNKEENKEKENKTQEDQVAIEENLVKKSNFFQKNQMKKGDYCVHILVEEVSNLSLFKKDFLPYPVVKVSCLNQTKRTQKVKTGCTDHTFNEHIYFDFIDLPKEVLDSARINIEVYDQNNSTKRSEFFGMFEFDLETIYISENHSKKNMWIGLANPEGSNISEVNGFIKISISVLHENDERVELNPEPANNTNCMIPTQIKLFYKMISISIFKGEEFPDMNTNMFSSEDVVNRDCNGYVECHYMGTVLKTKEVQMKNEVIYWNQVINISVSQPAISQKLVFHVKDSSFRKHQLIGSFEIDINDILSNKYSKLQVINIYGSSVLKDNEICNKMNENAEIGSRWKGRIYMRIMFKDIETPYNSVEDITNIEELTTALNSNPKSLWSVYVKLYGAYYLPTDDGTYQMRVYMQENKALFMKKKAKDRYITWNICKPLQCFTLTNNKLELPDIFIYLLDEKNNPLCFQRIKSSKFHLNNDVMIIKLLPDPCIGLVSNMYLSGFVRIKIKLFNKAIDGNVDTSMFRDGEDGVEEEDDDLENIGKVQKKQVNKSLPYTIVANVYMSRGLIAGDSTGKSDPYCSISILDKTLKTETRSKCVNGVWNQSLEFNNIYMDIDDKSTWPIMLLDVMDQDLYKSDMLGYAYVGLSDSAYKINSIDKIKPKWHKLYLENSNRQQGEILISFYIFDSNNYSLVRGIMIDPITIPYTFEINALGLRDLKPLSFIPIKKAYIYFDLNSVNVSKNTKDDLAPITTNPKDSGENPNINTVIKFDVNLPIDNIFLPEMQCLVYDYILKGLGNKLIGLFMLPLNMLIKKSAEYLKKNMEQGKKILKELKQKEKEKANELLYNIPPPKLTDESKGNLIKEDKAELADISNDKTKQEISTSKDKKNKQDYQSIRVDSSVNDANNELDLDLNIINEENKQSETFICNEISDLNKLYTGKINNDLLNAHKDESEYFVIKPSFKKYTIPGVKQGDKEYKEFFVENFEEIPKKHYYALGFNKRNHSTKTDKEAINNKKHYRRIYGKELENVTKLGLATPFYKSYLRRGKYEDIVDKSKATLEFFDQMTKLSSKILKKYKSKVPKNEEEEEEDEVIDNYDEEEEEEDESEEDIMEYNTFGYFKSLIRITQKNQMEEYLQFISNIKKEFKGTLPKELNFLTEFEDISKDLLTETTVIVRIYILELKNLAKKDKFSESDPYIKIKIGNKEKVNERIHFLKDMKDCKWYKYYDIPTDLPGSSNLTIQVYDYNDIFSDELIGETTIDIEDRYFDTKWRNIKNKPIETRQLRHPDFSNSQGSILLWLEMFEKDERHKMNSWIVEPEPPNELELRLIIWEAENIEMMDIEGTSDVYINAYVDQSDIHSTDIHFRCQNGTPSFNWRMIIPIKTPRDKYELMFQVFDNDILARDDYICGGKLNIFRFVNDANILDIPVTFNREYQNALGEKKIKDVEFLDKTECEDGTKFWLNMYKNGQKDGNVSGRILCSLEILPKWNAANKPAGKGRSEPNTNPYLPPPVGRIEFTMNPIKMFNQLVGPKFRKKVFKGCCIILLIIYLICIIPYVIYHFSANIVNPFNYIKKARKK